MYINFWYPVALSEELKDEPIKARILGQNFVAFRDSKGQPTHSVIPVHIEADHCQQGLSETIVFNALIMVGAMMVQVIAVGFHHWVRTQKFLKEHVWMPTQLRSKTA